MNRIAAVIILFPALLLLSFPAAQSTEGRARLRVQLIERMQPTAGTRTLPLGYSLQIRARGPGLVAPHLIVELQGVSEWVIGRDMAFTSCGDRVSVEPMHLTGRVVAWDLGRVAIPSHAQYYGPEYDVPTGRRLDINPWGCQVSFILTPRFPLAPASARRHRFLVRLYSRLRGGAIDRASLVAQLRWSGEYMDGPD